MNPTKAIIIPTRWQTDRKGESMTIRRVLVQSVDYFKAPPSSGHKWTKGAYEHPPKRR